MDKQQLCKILEAMLMAYDKPLSVDKLVRLLAIQNDTDSGHDTVATGPDRADIMAALREIESRCEGRHRSSDQVVSRKVQNELG